jgi:hypothetical protein
VGPLFTVSLKNLKFKLINQEATDRMKKYQTLIMVLICQSIQFIAYISQPYKTIRLIIAGSSLPKCFLEYQVVVSEEVMYVVIIFKFHYLLRD